MPTFEDIKPGARIRGLDHSGVAEIVQVSIFGPDALNVVFRVEGRVGERLIYRGEESTFSWVEGGRSYAFDADGALLKLASEAYRIRLAHLFDPYLAVSASQIEALPHQITAVYGEMLPRQPLRFLLPFGGIPRVPNLEPKPPNSYRRRPILRISRRYRTAT